jgi:hypothetical protein
MRAGTLQWWLAGIITAAALVASSAARAQMRADADLGAQWRMNSVARFMAGLPPIYPAHMALAQSDAWQAHATAMQAAMKKIGQERVAAMETWRNSAISPRCPAGTTLLYPFAGPDFLNAWWLFPDCETFVLFGLEHIGEVPDIEAMTPLQRERLLADVRAATADFFDRNYFITENMTRQLRTAQLRGVLPLMMISMAVSGLDILRIVPLDIAPRAPEGGMLHTSAAADERPPGTVRPPASRPRGRGLRALKGVTIEFMQPGSGVVRRLHYLSGDATDRGLARYPEFLAYIRSLAPTTTFLKSASYLLHGRDFVQLRNALLEVSGYLVQDDSGLPYAMLAARGWRMQLYGRYGVPIPPFERDFQPVLYRAYGEQKPERLPFVFGYQYHDYRDERSNVMVGRGPAVATQAAGSEGLRGVSLKSSTRLDR